MLAVTHAQCRQERRCWSTAISQKGGSSGRKEKSQSASKTKGKEDGRRRGTNRSVGTGTRKDRPERFVKSGESGRRREEKRGGENRKRDHFQLQRSVSQHGQCTIPRHVNPILMHTCTAGIFVIWCFVLSDWPRMLLSQCVTKAEDGGWAGSLWRDIP